MRQTRLKALEAGVAAVLDIGSSSITCFIVRFDTSPELEKGVVGCLAGSVGFRVISAAKSSSRGVRIGEIADVGEAEKAMRTAITAAQNMAKAEVEYAFVCLAGAEPRNYDVLGEMDLDGTSVSSSDVLHVLSECDFPRIEARREVLHAQPLEFVLDQHRGISDPRGRVGSLLATRAHVLSVDTQSILKVIDCTVRCGLRIAGIVSAAYASGISALVEEEQQLGSACIDMGGGTTGVSIFMKKHMIYADAVQMGGNHVTGDISMGLQIPMAMAERIKIFYGGVIATGMDDREMIDISGDTGDWHHDRRQVSRAELIGIMRPRVEEILEEVRSCLDAAGFDHMPSQQIVLTGAASQIPGLDGLASRILGSPVRLGRPMRVHGLPQAATGPGFASAIGTCLIAAGPSDEAWDFFALEDANAGGDTHHDRSGDGKIGGQGLERAIAGTPNAEIISATSDARLIEFRPSSELSEYCLKDIVDRLRDAGELMSKKVLRDNQYRALSDEIDHLMTCVERYRERPQRLYDVANQVVRRIEAKEEAGECPEASKDVSVHDFKSELHLVSRDLRDFDPSVKEVLVARQSAHLENMPRDIRERLPEIAADLGKISNDALASELVEDAEAAAFPHSEEGKMATYRFSSRLLRIFQFSLKSLRGGLKEGAEISKEANVIISASSSIQALIRYLIGLF